MEVIEEQAGSHSGSFESQSGGSPRQGAVGWGEGLVPREPTSVEEQVMSPSPRAGAVSRGG